MKYQYAWCTTTVGMHTGQKYPPAPIAAAEEPDPNPAPILNEQWYGQKYTKAKNTNRPKPHTTTPGTEQKHIQLQLEVQKSKTNAE